MTDEPICKRCAKNDQLRSFHCTGAGVYCIRGGCHRAWVCERCGAQWLTACTDQRHGNRTQVAT